MTTSPLNSRQLFADHIRTYRKSLGLSQEVFAERLGIPRMSLSRYETCARGITFDTLVRWSRRLNVPVRELVPDFCGEKGKKDGGSGIMS